MDPRRDFLLPCLAAACVAAEPLPLPDAACLAPEPPLPAAVVTAGGQRRLLAEVDVGVRWDAATGALVGDHPGWWLVNYPRSRIAAAADADPLRAITGIPAEQIRNWWLYTPGAAATEPAAASGPAPIVPTPGPAIIVDQGSAVADDAGPGTAERPLRTLAAALPRLAAGALVRVRPGIYREALAITVSGSAQRPIIIEGERGSDGRMPVISGNDVLAPEAWAPVAGLPGVWRHPLPGDAYGTVAVDGAVLEEAGDVRGLRPGQVVVCRSSAESALPRLSGDEAPAAGQERDGRTWTRIAADAAGTFTLPGGDAVWYLAAWVWVDPARRAAGEIFDPQSPRPIGGDLTISGAFRAFRQTGSDSRGQVNQIRLWLDGAALSGVPGIGRPSAWAGYGYDGDTWKNFAMHEGWNRLLIQLDTTTRPQSLGFGLHLPKALGAVVSAAAAPADARHGDPAIPSLPHLREALLLGPFPASRDPAVYIRLTGDRDPRGAVVDAAARHDAVVALEGAHVHLRGFELRHGCQFQQRGLVRAAGPGSLVEGCLIREPEWRAITLGLGGGDQSDPPVTIRGNWLLRPGSVGIGAEPQERNDLAADNLARAPGRRRAVIEWNRISDSSRLGQDRWWESGAIKLIKTSGAVIRYNDLLTSDGPGIWLDWENYGNRIIGNRIARVTGCAVGIEASPGPNLVGANIAIDTRPGGVWFRSAFLSWSSAQVWLVGNTVDGRWNAEHAHWKGQDGSDGIYLDEGADDRGTLWGRLPSRRQAILHNLVVGCDAAIELPDPGRDLVSGNVGDTERGRDRGRFREPAGGDYRPAGDGGEATATAIESRFLRHDALGLPWPDGPRIAGACRADPPLPPGTRAVIEVETIDGRLLRVVR